MTPTPSSRPARFHRQLSSRVAEFEALAEALSQWCRQQGVPSPVIGQVVLILDELFANIVMHGYRHDPQGRVEVQAHIGQDEVCVTLTDHAPAFNPLLVPEPDTRLPLEERQIGGLGLLFVRRTADTLAYRRRDPDTPQAANELCFHKRFALSRPGPTSTDVSG